MAVSNPLQYIVTVAGQVVSSLVDAIKVNASSSTPVTREVVALGDDSDYTTTPIVAQVDPTTRGLKVLVVGGVTAPLFATANIAIAAGSAAGAAVNAPGHLYSVTVTQPGSAALAITDGMGGPEIAYVPANFPGGDIPIYAVKRFATSLYVSGGSNAPAISMGYSA